MVGEEAALVPAHAQVIDEEAAGCGRVGRGVERAAEGREDGRGIGVEVANLADDGADKVGLVWWEVAQGARALGLVDLTTAR